MYRPPQLAWLTILWLLLGVSTSDRLARAGELLGNEIEFSPFHLELREYATIPGGNRNIISMTTRPDDPRLYVTKQDGTVWVINENVNGTTTPTQWFHFGTAVSTATPRQMDGNSGQRGLQSIAFHPDFASEGAPGYGKLYTTMLEQRPTNTAGHHYLGNSGLGNNVNADGVLAEWTYDHVAGQVLANSYRALFRVQMPHYDHPIKQARFNPYAMPGDEDYGLLYMTHGDSNIKHSPGNDALRLDNALGKMIRIDPLQAGDAPYSIPASNPFAGSEDPNVLQEVYAYGFRNPHTYSFNRDDASDVHILVGDIGRNNIEEINLVLPGANYGWPAREGTFLHRQLQDGAGAGYITGVSGLPESEADTGYVYPVAQYDHDANTGQFSSGSAVASGHVVRNSSDPNLHNQLIFTNFAWKDGIVFHADFEEMLSAVAQLDPDDPERDSPEHLTQAVVRKLRLALDHDNNPATPPQVFDDFLELLGDTRSDTRFGEGRFGEMYISSKRDGKIYLVTNSLPLSGDYNRDGLVDAADYTTWRDTLGNSGHLLAADGTGDRLVDEQDFAVWGENFGGAWSGGGSATALAVPEPGAAVVMAGALLGCTLYRKRRSRSSGCA